MTPATALAAVAGATAVAGVWEALAAFEQAAVGRALAALTAPLAALRREGRVPTLPERRRLVIVGAATLLAGGWLVGGVVAGVACAAGGPLAVRAILRARRARWRADLARAVPLVARALADALAGGHAVRGALTVAAEGGIPGAAGRELRLAARALALGATTDEVLQHLRRRAAAPAWDTLIAAIVLQRDAVGDSAGRRGRPR